MPPPTKTMVSPGNVAAKSRNANHKASCATSTTPKQFRKFGRLGSAAANLEREKIRIGITAQRSHCRRRSRTMCASPSRTGSDRECECTENWSASVRFRLSRAQALHLYLYIVCSIYFYYFNISNFIWCPSEYNKVRFSWIKTTLTVIGCERILSASKSDKFSSSSIKTKSTSMCIFQNAWEIFWKRGFWLFERDGSQRW